MASRITASSRSSGFMLAIMFNTLLICMPILAAQIMSNTYANRGFGDEMTGEALAQTRANIDQTFSDIAPRGEDAMLFWSDLVDREVLARDTASARGFLLAAPQMLDRATISAIEAAAEAQASGTADERLVSAALLFLPEDARKRYEEATQPPKIPVVIVPEEIDPENPEAAQEPVAPPAEPLQIVETPPSNEELDPLQPAMSDTKQRSEVLAVLGSREDLAQQSMDWMNGDPVDTFVLRITGLGLAEQAERGGEAGQGYAEAASILKSAWRGRRLTPELSRTLTARLESALPLDTLRDNLTPALAELAPMSVRADRVEEAFVASINTRQLARLETELDQIRRINEVTSPRAAITLLEQVKSADELRRARLIAEAGGDRSVALVKQIGPQALGLADTGVRWTRAILMQVLALAASAMVLLWVMLSALAKAFFVRENVEMI